MRASSSVKKVSSLNPLRALRETLGQNGKRLSTYKLADLIEIPSATLRAIESGTNAFTAGLQQRLRRRGIAWDPKNGCWSFAFNPKLSLSVELIVDFNKLGRPNALWQDIDAHMAARRIVALLDAVPATEYNVMLSDLHETLEQFRQRYHANRAEKTFAETALKYSYTPTPSGAQTLTRGYSGKDQGDIDNLLDLRELRKRTPPGEAQSSEVFKSDAA
jgi:hypothetical protein